MKPRTYPRVNDCLYGWCPERTPECERCDAIIRIIERGTDHPHDRHVAAYYHNKLDRLCGHQQLKQEV